MRFVLADKSLVVAGRVYEGFPLLIGDDGDAMQPAQDFLWHLIRRNGRIASKSTWANYGRAIYDFFAYATTNHFDWRSPPVGGMPTAIEAWRDWSKGTLGLKSSTINQRIRVVGRFYKWALKQNLIDALPFDYVPVQPRRHPEFLSHVDERGGKFEVPEVMLAESDQEFIQTLAFGQDGGNPLRFATQTTGPQFAIGATVFGRCIRLGVDANRKLTTL